jgi:hypothetical protein
MISRFAAGLRRAMGEAAAGADHKLDPDELLRVAMARQ